jgi:hypothetical protein
MRKRRDLLSCRRNMIKRSEDDEKRKTKQADDERR